MTNNELIERYVYAVTRRLPVKMRSDIDKELNGLIADMLEERCGDMTPTETDVKVVLTELGTPSQLAAKYDPNGERSLIGPKYFGLYLNVLTITLLAGGIGMVIASVLSIIAEGYMEGNWIEIICGTLADVWNTLLATFGMVTAVFAVLEYKKVDISSEDELMSLPTVPADKEKISRGDSIVSIVFGIILLVLFLFAPQLMGAYIANVGDNPGVTLVPIFNTETVRSLWYLFVMSFGAEIFDSCYRLIVGRYNFKVAIVTAVTGIINTIAAGFILLNSRIMNPDFEPLFAEAIAADGGPTELAPLFSNGIAALVFAIIVIANIAGIAKAFLKAFKYRENN